MVYTVYIFKSFKDGKKYIGFTKDINIRLSQHNSGLVKSTKSRRPFEVIRTENFSSEKEAVTREKFLKTHKGYNELKKIGIY